ncbi:hypothetical protein BsWGS_18592 [Bradybaena similaris]
MKYPLIVASLVTGAVGCLFILIGESSTQWVTSDQGIITVGLFVACGPAGCASYAAEGGIGGARALVTIGFLASLAALIVLIVYYIKHIRKDTTDRTLSVVTAGLFLGAALAALIGSIIFATSGKSIAESAFGVAMNLGYSFGLTIVGSLVSGAAGGLALVHRMSLQN